MVRALHFCREKISALSPSSTRAELCLPTLGPLKQLSFFLFLQINSKSHHGRIRTPGPTVLIVLIVAFEGNHWTTGAIGFIGLIKGDIYAYICIHILGDNIMVSVDNSIRINASSATEYCRPSYPATHVRHDEWRTYTQLHTCSTRASPSHLVSNPLPGVVRECVAVSSTGTYSKCGPRRMAHALAGRHECNADKTLFFSHEGVMFHHPEGALKCCCAVVSLPEDR